VPSAYGAPLGANRYPPLPGSAANLNHIPKNQTLKANIMITSLNMNSYMAPASNMNGIEKWSMVYQTMKENKVAVLTLQETHLDNTMLLSIDQCFGKRLRVINSKLPGNPRILAGVAFVINRALVAPKDLVAVELIEGRVLAIKFKWHNDKEIHLLNVYAPNDRRAHPGFWEMIDTKRQSKGLRCPDLMLGDFNVTEDPIDRVPAHLDDTDAIATLRNL
jgi:exonuclease III